MFAELTDKRDYSERELSTLKFWKESHIFEKSIASREGRPAFTFFEGPPTANGRPGIHHVMSRTLKDLVCRYKTMRGFQVHRKAGWDTHGLPVEIEVEKSLGFKHKDQIVRFGVAKFNEECKKSVWKYKTEWEELTERMGYWVDMGNPYITFENFYIESVWWSLKKYFDKDMIYRGYKIQPYCPRCETPLSSHEVSLGYQDVRDPSVYVKMKVKGEDAYFLVWTTTPWTLISNVGLAVHPKVDYVRVRHRGETLILAEARLSVLDGEVAVESKFKGRTLAGMEYERLFSYHPVTGKAFYVVEADFVTTEDGSGIVHMAPAYGEDDYQISKKYGLPTIHPVNKSGEFGAEVKDFAGKFVKDADPDIIRNLKERHLLYKKETITHTYPHCWRCESPLLYYARDSWYIATTKYSRKMVELNKQIGWHPAEVGEGRFGNWLEENKDWSLSRDRFWGTPLPIWVCEKCGGKKCVGSIEEYRQGSGIAEPLDLHKPFVDAVTFPCASCAGTMRRVPELIDVWYDSGAMQFAQWHYPFENKGMIDELRAHPADYICEGIDQTRGWFYSLHSLSTYLFDRPAYKNVIVNELILDKNGQKMSKSKGNTVDPFEVLRKYGADATRWYLVATSPPWRPTLFDESGLLEVQRKFLGTLLNTYAFFSLYANIDGFAFAEADVPLASRPEIDRWIISALNSLVAVYLDAMESYDVTRAARAVSDFTIDQLSNWYVRRNRRRFWKNDPGADKLSAYQTLYRCLVTVTELMAPFAPFMSDELYRNLAGGVSVEMPESVHLASLPAPDPSAIDRPLESRMEKAQRIASLVRAIRNKANIKVRQPLSKLIIPVRANGEREEISRMEGVILDEINVKSILFVTDDSEIVHKSAKPNFKKIGPKFGKSVQAVAQAIKGFTPREIHALERDGRLLLTPAGGGEQVEIGREDVEIFHHDIKGWVVESDGTLTVALDTSLGDELISEGLAREFVNRIQNMRKDAGFDVTDRIRITFSSDEKLAAAVKSQEQYIKGETLAVEISRGEGGSAWDINGLNCSISIERVRMNGK